jgi:hypothetical protein
MKRETRTSAGRQRCGASATGHLARPSVFDDIWHFIDHVPGTQMFIDVSPIYEPHGTRRNRAMKNKIVSAAEAVAIIRDGDTIACSGFVGSGTPDELIVALEQRFVETGSPRDLTLKLGEALSRRRVAPHIFETSGEAHAFVQSKDVKDPPGPAA